MIFLRDFYDEQTKQVNTSNEWVWYIHVVSYAYIIHIYFFTGAGEHDKSTASKMWIPLDCCLTCIILVYYLFYKFIDTDKEESNSSQTHIDSDDESCFRGANGKQIFDLNEELKTISEQSDAMLTNIRSTMFNNFHSADSSVSAGAK